MTAEETRLEEIHKVLCAQPMNYGTWNKVKALIKSYAKQHACNFLDWVDEHLNENPDDSKLTAQKLYDEWQSKQLAGD